MSQVHEYSEKIEVLKRRIADAKARLTQQTSPSEVQESRNSIAIGEAILPVLEQMKRFQECLDALR